MFAPDFSLGGIKMHPTFNHANQSVKAMLSSALQIFNISADAWAWCFFGNGMRRWGTQLVDTFDLGSCSCKIVNMVPILYLNSAMTSSVAIHLSKSIGPCNWWSFIPWFIANTAMSCLKVAFAMLHSVIWRADILINSKHLIINLLYHAGAEIWLQNTPPFCP